jgi:hypothetical protein
VRVFDWWFRDRRTGRIVVGQFPNIPLWIFIATVGLRWIVTTGSARTVVDGIALVALAWWAIDEAVRGVNPWRRVLGLGVVGFVLVGLLR